MPRNSEIWLLQGCPLDYDHKHSAIFENKQKQIEYFEGKIHPTVQTRDKTIYFKIQNLNYVRTSTNSVRVQIPEMYVKECNYMVIKDVKQSSGAERYYYAFIYKVDYISEEVSEITFKIDVLQTYWWDFSLGNVYVEREHTPTDNIGDNIISENVDIGELVTAHEHDEIIDGEPSIVQGEIKIDHNRLMGCVITTKKLKNRIEFRDPLQGRIMSCYVNTKDSPYGTPKYDDKGNITISDTAPNGVPFNFYSYYGFPVNEYECRYYYKQTNPLTNQPFQNDYDMQDCTMHEDGFVTDDRFFCLQVFFYALREGEIECWNDDGTSAYLTPQDIVCVYLYPSELCKKDCNKPNIDSTSVMPFWFNDFKERTYGRKIELKEFLPRDFQGYVPNNKKLYTFPFSRLTISSNNGDIKEYKYEEIGRALSESERSVVLTELGTLYGRPCVAIFPPYYKGTWELIDESCLMNNFPEVAFASDPYQEYLNANGTQLLFGAIASGVSALNGGYSSLITGEVKNYMSPASSTVMTIASDLARLNDVSSLPKNVIGAINISNLICTISKYEFSVRATQIKRHNAEIIDKYFDKYGYAVKKIKVPNIYDSNGRKRPCWNYIKTIGCDLNTYAGRGFTCAVEEEIEGIFDKGITFWNNADQIGDYWRNNKPI